MNEALRPYFQAYGCDLNPDGFIVTKGQKATSIHVTVKKAVCGCPRQKSSSSRGHLRQRAWLTSSNRTGISSR